MSDKKDLNWLKTKQEGTKKNFGMVGMGYVIEMYNELQAEITNLNNELRQERKAVDFYADMENWQLRTFNETGVNKGWAVRIKDSDASYLTPANRNFGGRIARDTQSKRAIEI